MRAIVIGSDGIIGGALTGALADDGHAVYGTTRRPERVRENRLFLDLAADVERVALPDVDIAFFCAAVASFAACRENPNLAHRVNVTSPATLARRFAERGARLVLLSTSAVYDWSIPHPPADRAPCPLTKYGEFAAAAERSFASLGGAASILRLTKLLTVNSELFCDWIARLSRRHEISAFSDLRMSPISIDDALGALRALIGNASGGIYQVSGKEDVSYHDAASYLASRLGADPKLVDESKAADAGFPREQIPRFASLDATRLTQMTGWLPPRAHDVIDKVYGPMIEAERVRGILA